MTGKALARMMLGCGVMIGIAACGQKGPLYLPDKGGEVVTRPAGEPAKAPPDESRPKKEDSNSKQDEPAK